MGSEWIGSDVASRLAVFCRISAFVFSSGPLPDVEEVERRLKSAGVGVTDSIKLEGDKGDTGDGKFGLQAGGEEKQESRDFATALSISEVARKSTDFLLPGGLFFNSPLWDGHFTAKAVFIDLKRSARGRLDFFSPSFNMSFSPPALLVWLYSLLPRASLSGEPSTKSLLLPPNWSFSGLALSPCSS